MVLNQSINQSNEQPKSLGASNYMYLLRSMLYKYVYINSNIDRLMVCGHIWPCTSLSHATHIFKANDSSEWMLINIIFMVKVITGIYFMHYPPCVWALGLMFYTNLKRRMWKHTIGRCCHMITCSVTSQNGFPFTRHYCRRFAFI